MTTRATTLRGIAGGTSVSLPPSLYPPSGPPRGSNRGGNAWCQCVANACADAGAERGYPFALLGLAAGHVAEDFDGHTLRLLRTYLPKILKNRFPVSVDWSERGVKTQKESKCHCGETLLHKLIHKGKVVRRSNINHCDDFFARPLIEALAQLVRVSLCGQRDKQDNRNESSHWKRLPC